MFTIVAETLTCLAHDFVQVCWSSDRSLGSGVMMDQFEEAVAEQQPDQSVPSSAAVQGGVEGQGQNQGPEQDASEQYDTDLEKEGKITWSLSLLAQSGHI